MDTMMAEETQLAGGYRRAARGAGGGRAAAGAARLSRGDRARAAPADAAGRAAARRRLLPDGDPARAGRIAGRSADLSRVVELLAEGCGSVGWNLANNSIGQLVTLGLPDDGVQEIYGERADTVIAGTAVQGGGQAVPVEGGYRVSGRWSFGSGCQESQLDARQLPDPRRRPAAPQPGRQAALLARHIQARRGRDRAGQLGRRRAARHRQLRLDGRRRVPARAAHDAACRRAARQPVGALAGRHLRLAGPVLGRAASQRRDHRHRARRHRRADRAGRRQDAARPRPACFATTRRCRTRSAGPTRSSMPGALIAAR